MPDAAPSDLVTLLTQVADRDKALALALQELSGRVGDACGKVASFDSSIVAHTAAVKARADLQAEYRADVTQEQEREAARTDARRRWWGDMAQRFAGSAAGTTVILTLAALAWYLVTGSTSPPTQIVPPSPAAGVTLPAGATP